MRVEHGKIEDQTTLSESLELHGMWVGDCTVVDGGHLQLNGTVTGNLTVEKNSTATVHGMVSGDLTAMGRVEVKGMVVGHASGDGLLIAAGAHISGHRHP